MLVCLAANPSIDKLFEIERLVKGDIHRPSGFLQVAGWAEVERVLGRRRAEGQ